MRHDTIIIGGSFAGLSAALYLGRARRSVCVLDTASPRNRFANASHGVFAHDGDNPLAMLDTMRAQVAAYPTVRFVNEKAVDAAMHDDQAFSITLTSGQVLAAKTLLLASGIADILPTLPGLAERWGESVLHCPYCHGYEFSGEQLGVLYLSPMSVHQACLIAEWGPTTLFLDGAGIEPDAAADLARRGIAIEPAPVAGLAGAGRSLSAVVLADGRERALDALFISPPYRLNSDIAQQLGCAIEAGPLGPIVSVDESKATSIAGVSAAGDIARMRQGVTFACADGVMAAVAIHQSMVF